MSGLMSMAEARTEEVIALGALDNLPGRGRPLMLNDERLMLEGLCAVYRILRNAGFRFAA